MTTINRKKAPVFHQVDNIKFLNVVKTHLKNRLTVNYINGGSQDILKIDFIFNAGNWYQKKPLIATATNSLIKEGTKNYSAFEIAEGIDQYGAFLEMENSYDTATITLYTLSKYLDKVLPYVKEVILYPKFSEKEFTIYKDNALEKFKINLEKVSFVARKEFMELLFGKTHPYGINVSASDYKDLSLDDITNFHKDHYNLSNCKILVSGKVNPDVIMSLDHFFGNEIQEGNPLVKEESEISSEKSPLFIEKKNALQSAIRIGKIFPNKLHEDYYGLQILNTVLGGYFGSRLMTNIREDKGYTYGINSGIMSLKNSGYFFITTEVGSDVTKNALTEIYKEIELLRTNKISKNELDLVKNYMLGRLLKSCDGPFNMATLFESVDDYGLDYSYYNNYINTIKKITPETLLALGVKYLNPSDLKEVVVGRF